MSVVILQRCIPHYREVLFAELHRRFGWTVVAASNFPRGSYLEPIEAEADYVRRYPFVFHDPRNPYHCRVPLAQILRDLRPRTVIAELSLSMSSTFGLIARRLLRGAARVYYWSHGFNMERGFGFRALPFQVPRVLLSKMADGNLVYSDEGKQFLSRFVDPARIFVIRNTVALRELPKPAAPDRYPRPRGPALLTIGRITRDKDFPGLVRVFSALAREQPQATLTLIGDGPDAERTRSAAGDLLGKRIFMTGAIYDEALLATHFSAADLAVFYGAVGLSVNHALLYGLPVIAFDRTPSGPFHHPEITNVVDAVTGMRVRPYTAKAMLDGLRSFLARYPSPREALGATIARYVEDNLTLQSMLDDFAAVQRVLQADRDDSGTSS